MWKQFGPRVEGCFSINPTRGKSWDLRENRKVRTDRNLFHLSQANHEDSGKTSLMLSIFRMIELNSGTIDIDGLDISTIPRQEIRSRLNGVSQDTVFIKGSVRLNADPTNSSSDRAIWDALKSVQLMNVVQEKGGLTVNIDDLHLSHGQKQLFCLVRAILHPSKILVLDEATSKYDSPLLLHL